MRKLSFLLFFITFFGFGQTYYLGFHYGFTFSSPSVSQVISNHSLANRQPKIAMNMGLQFRCIAKKHLVLQAELLYTQKGMKFDDIVVGNNFFPYTDIYENLNYCFNYICLPLKVGLISGKRFKFFFTPGIVPSFLINANIVREGEDGRIKQENISSSSSKFNLYLQYEAGISYLFKNQVELFISGLYYHSLLKTDFELFQLPSSFNPVSVTSVRFNGIMATIGVRILLKTPKH